MNDPATLSKDDLLELLERKADRLRQQDAELQAKDADLQTKDAEPQAKTNIIEQLEQKNKELEAASKLWLERFGHRSERCIADPDQLRLDFGDTDDAADAAAGLAKPSNSSARAPRSRTYRPRGPPGAA